MRRRGCDWNWRQSLTSRYGKAGRVAEGMAESRQTDASQALHHKMPVAWLSGPLPPGSGQPCFTELASPRWQGAPGSLAQQPSVFLSFPPSQQDEYISLLLCEPTYLEFAGNKHLSCVIFGAFEEFVLFQLHLG